MSAPREQTLNTVVRRAWAAPPSRYGTAMLRRFGWFYYALGLGRMFRRIRLEDHSAERIREAAKRGPVVYVMLRRSRVDHLVLNTVLNRRRLPLSVWANGTTSFFWQPIAAAYRDLWHRIKCFFRDGRAPDPVTSGWVNGRLESGNSITVFIDDPDGPLPLQRRHTPKDILETLIAWQVEHGTSILLVPSVVVWDRSPDHTPHAVRDFLLGEVDEVGPLSLLSRIYVRSRDAFVQVGEPVDLMEFNERVRPERRSRALQTLLRRYLHRESRVVRGPVLLPRASMKQMVLDNPPMRRLVAEESASLGLTPDRIRAQMSKEYDTIAARFSFGTVRMLSVVLRPLWTRVFSGVDVRPEDMDAIRGAMRNGSVVLIPCHKSHLDYVLLSWVFFSHDLIVPHVVAGINLAIWPVSLLLRGAGAFFIKRSFTGQRIHPMVFSRYLRELIRQGYPVEFFIEGGRTRSGKLLPPKLGVLGMVLEAAELRPTGKEVTLLPISLAYERVAEEGAYARELGGEEKTPETMQALIRSTAIIRRRFGRVYLRVGTPIPCGDIVDAHGTQPRWSKRPADDRREALLRVGERVVHHIGEATVVLPTSVLAAALLSHHRRGIAQDELFERATRFRVFLQRCGALEAESMKRWTRAMEQATDRFAQADRIEALDLNGQRIWSVQPEGRITLAFYQNQILHFFAKACLVTAAIRAITRDLDTEGFTADGLHEAFAHWLWTLRREFIFDPEATSHDLLAAGLAQLVDYGAIHEDDGVYQVSDVQRIGEMYALISSLLQSYDLILRDASRLSSHRWSSRNWVQELQGERDALLAGSRIRRPETLSLLNLENAIRAFVEEGTLTRQDGILAVNTTAWQRRVETWPVGGS